MSRLFNHKNLIIFDFDGTLVDFKIDYISLRAEIISYLYSCFDFPPDFFSIKERIFITLSKAKNYTLKTTSDEEWNHILTSADEIMKKWEWKAAKINKIHPDVKNTLKILRKNGFRLAIFTLEPEEITNYLLKKEKIDHLFDLIASRDKVKKLKPNPEHLNYILEKLNVRQDQVIVVGDHQTDIKCGKNINALCIGKLSQLHSKGQLLSAGAEFIVPKISDLISLMKLE